MFVSFHFASAKLSQLKFVRSWLFFLLGFWSLNNSSSSKILTHTWFQKDLSQKIIEFQDEVGTVT